MKISIITITYNSEKTLEETIKSVISQDLSNVELEYIVVDGKSTDDTLNIIKKYESSISKWVSEKDRGISDAFNKGIKLATGEVVGIINSDDMLLPNALKNVAESYDSEYDVFFGDGKRLQMDGRITEYKANPKLELLKKSMELVHPSVFIKKEAYEKYGLYDIDLKCVMDRELLLRMYVNNAKFKYINKALTLFRDGGVSNTSFFTKVLPEEEEISIKYGMRPGKAKIQRIKKSMYMHCVFFYKKVKRFLKFS